jgi:DNA-binding LacI/PurR family transcriptional regulator
VLAVAALLGGMDGAEVPAVELVPTELVVRASTGAPRAS